VSPFAEINSFISRSQCPTDTLASFSARLSEVSTGEPFEMAFPSRGIDSKFRPFLTRVVPIRDLIGKIIRWFGANTDVSAEVEA
jgi:hypothetical protein